MSTYNFVRLPMSLYFDTSHDEICTGARLRGGRNQWVKKTVESDCEENSQAKESLSQAKTQSPVMPAILSR